MNLDIVGSSCAVRIFDGLLQGVIPKPRAFTSGARDLAWAFRGTHPSLPKTILPRGFCDQPHDLHRAPSVIVNPCKGAPIWQEEVSIKSFFSEIWARTPS